jgi:uncharacterized protein YacL
MLEFLLFLITLVMIAITMEFCHFYIVFKNREQLMKFMKLQRQQKEKEEERE